MDQNNDPLILARRMASGEDVDKDFFDVFIKKHTEAHPTYHATVENLIRYRERIEKRGMLTRLAITVFGLNNGERQYDVLREQEQHALKEIVKRASEEGYSILRAVWSQKPGLD